MRKLESNDRWYCDSCDMWHSGGSHEAALVECRHGGPYSVLVHLSTELSIIQRKVCAINHTNA